MVVQTMAVGTYAAADNVAADLVATNEVAIDIQMTNMDAMKTLINYIGVDFFTKRSDEVIAEGTIKSKFQKMMLNPNEPISNYDMVNLLADIVDVKERKSVEDAENGIESKVDLNSNLMTFFELGYLPNPSEFRPSGNLSKSNFDNMLDNMLGYVVKTEEDLANIPEDAKRVTIINSGITVENMTLNADVFVSPKAKSGITFKNMEINGSLEIAGGNEASPVVLENTNVERIRMVQSVHNTYLNVKGTSEIKSLVTKIPSTIIIEDDSKVEVVETKDVTNLVVKDGVRIDELNTKAETVLEAEKGAAIEKLKAEADTKLEGANVIKDVEITGDKTQLDDSEAKKELAPSPGEDTTSGDSSSGSSSGSSRDDDDDDSDRNESGSSETPSPEPEPTKGPSTPVDAISMTMNKELLVIFADEYGAIDKTSAENTANYSISGIGHPTSAVFTDYMVRLVFSGLQANQTYTLEVYNVGNAQNHVVDGVSKEFMLFDEIDLTQPKVVSVVNEDHGMLLIEFDESVRMDLNEDDDLGVYYEAVNDSSISGDFWIGNYYNNNEKIVAIDATELEGSGLEYRITGFYGLTDNAGNSIAPLDTEFTFTTGDTYNEVDHLPLLLGIEQSDEYTFCMMYDKNVWAYDYDYIEFAGESYKFKTKYDGQFIYLTYESPEPFPFKVGDEITVQHYYIAKDYARRRPAYEDYTFTWAFADTTLPKVDEVMSLNDHQLNIHFDSKISTFGEYEIQNSSGDALEIYDMRFGSTDSDLLIKTRANSPLESGETYTLVCITPAKDMSGNTAEVFEPIEFTGSHVAFEKLTLEPISMRYGYEFDIIGNEELPTGIYTVTSGGAIDAEILFEIDYTVYPDKYVTVADDALDLYVYSYGDMNIELEQYNALLSSETYTYTVDVSDDSYYEDYSYTFSGTTDLIDESSIVLDTDSGDIYIPDWDFDEHSRIVVYVNDGWQSFDDEQIIENTINFFRGLKAGDEITVVIRDYYDVIARTNWFIVK